LPSPGGFGAIDLRCCNRRVSHRHVAFLELP
jgi:hypothetical protein